LTRYARYGSVTASPRSSSTPCIQRRFQEGAHARSPPPTPRLPALVLALSLLAALLAAAAPALAGPSPAVAGAAAAPAERPAILFSADGMRPDLVDRYAADGDHAQPA
jgi:hypothetical protein